MLAAAATPLALNLLFVGTLAGLMIGCVGIGGVIIVPILSLALGVPVGTAAAAAMVGYIGTGLAGTLAFGRNGSIDNQLAGLLCLGAVPGALTGAWIVRTADPFVVQATIACLAGGAGLHSLLKSRADFAPRPQIAFGVASAMLVGCLVGLISAVTGTGGPLVLVPLLMWLGFPVLGAVGLGQAIQIPVAITATGGAMLFGSLDYAIAIALTIGLVVGCPAGAWVSHRIEQRALRTVAATVLLGTSCIMAATLAFR
ncbi:sulfite exporter TauE/SafE family protein [Methylobacterium sp. P5_C11]